MSKTPQPTVLAELKDKIFNKYKEHHLAAIKYKGKSKELENEHIIKCAVLFDVLKEIEASLPREREQIEGAYLIGCLNECNKIMCTPSDYFTKNYVQE